jgi:hypothetical protein
MPSIRAGMAVRRMGPHPPGPMGGGAVPAEKSRLDGGPLKADPRPGEAPGAGRNVKV